jgi:hypothetical protein
MGLGAAVVLTVRTETVELDAVAEDTVAGVLFELFDEVRVGLDVGVDDAAALDADEVDVGDGGAGVVAGVVVAEAEFEDFAEVGEDVEGLVDGGEAGGGEAGQELLVELLGAGVIVGMGEELDDGETLGGETMVRIF